LVYAIDSILGAPYSLFRLHPNGGKVYRELSVRTGKGERARRWHAMEGIAEAVPQAVGRRRIPS
jgi:hypothetical protein